MVSSRKQSNVDRAVDSLREQYGNESVSGVVCHVGKDADRKNLIQEVYKFIYTKYCTNKSIDYCKIW